MQAYIQGAIYQYIKDNKEETGRFIVIDLFGGSNRKCARTPLHFLYEYHLKQGKSGKDAETQAGIDLGYLVKEVLKDDKNIIADNSEKDYYATRYQYIK